MAAAAAEETGAQDAEVSEETGGPFSQKTAWVRRMETPLRSFLRTETGSASVLAAATVLARYQHLEQVPQLATEWDVPVRGAKRLAATLAEQRERVLLFRELATLRTDAPIGADVDALRWMGPRAELVAWAERLGTPALHHRASMLAAARG